ncbi:MAG: tRNA 2-selenouridine(34) synthase MnmH [Pseudomonadales bacterium]
MSDELLALVRRGTPFIDVRAPGEAARGTVPGACNLPILNDAERARVGTTYKQQGPDAAVRAGHRLVSGTVREARVAAWADFANQHENAWIFCWRGGQRSAIAADWLAAAGHALPRVPGGFKALRGALTEALRAACSDPRPWIILAGRTGSGKTDFLRSAPCSIDLEGLAAHRGSAFGATETEQPTPVTFENALAKEWIQHSGPYLLLEDESRTIGRLALPQHWHARMQESPVALLEVNADERRANIVREYVVQPLRAGVAATTLRDRYTQGLHRIERRLGGLRRAAVQTALDLAFAAGIEPSGAVDTALHEAWVDLLLRDYYDPMYDHQINGKTRRVVIRGDASTLRDFFSSLDRK